MADLGAYKDKFSDSGQRVLEYALNESRRRDQNYVSVEHILSALASEESDLFTQCGGGGDGPVGLSMESERTDGQWRDAIQSRLDRKSTRLNSSHGGISRMPSSA